MLDFIEDYIPHYIQQSSGDKDVWTGDPSFLQACSIFQKKQQ